MSGEREGRSAATALRAVLLASLVCTSMVAGVTALDGAVAATNQGTLEGTVTDEDGTAIENATVRVIDEDAEEIVASAETDTRGNYSVDVPDGTYTLLVDPDGYLGETQDVTIQSGESTTADFGLVAGGALEGTVTDEDGNALAGVDVEIYSGGERYVTVETDENGAYRADLPVGEHTVEVDPYGYEETNVSVTIGQNETTTEPVVLTERPTGTVEGTVTDENGTSIPNATVTLFARDANAVETVETGADGSYSATVYEGEYSVYVHPDGYVFSSTDVTVAANETSTATFELAEGGVLEGTVTDESGDPIEGIRVEIYRDGERQVATITDQDGTYWWPVEVGEYTVEIDPLRYESTTVEVTVAQNQTTTTNATLAERPTGTIEGTVTDENGTAVEDADITIFYDGGVLSDVPVDADGSYSVSVPPGDYTVVADADGRLEDRTEVTVTENETTTAGFELAEAAVLEGTVTDGTETIEDAHVTALQDGDVVASARVSDDGSFSLDLPGGEHRIRVDAVGYEYTDRNVSVAVGQTATESFALASVPTGTIEGRITDETGDGIGGASVSVTPDTGPYLGVRIADRPVTTNETGHYSIAVEEGAVDVSAQADGYYHNDTDGVHVAGAESTTVDLSLPRAGEITGQITYRDGEPAADGIVLLDGPVFEVAIANETGHYSIEVPEGDYVLRTGYNGTSPDLVDVTTTADDPATADFEVVDAEVTHASVEHVGGPEPDMANVSVGSQLSYGFLNVWLTDESSDEEFDTDLDGLGVEPSTEFEITLTVTEFEPDVLRGFGDDLEWNVTANESGGYDVTVRVTAADLQENDDVSRHTVLLKDPAIDWPSNDTATNASRTVSLTLTDSSYVYGDAVESVDGLSITTDAQSFSRPVLTDDGLETTVYGPAKTVDGQSNDGYVEVFVPDSQLAAWGVEADGLSARYRGDRVAHNVTVEDGGVRVRVEVPEFGGTVNVTPEASTGGATDDTSGSDGDSSGGDSPSDDTTSDESPSDDSTDDSPTDDTSDDSPTDDTSTDDSPSDDSPSSGPDTSPDDGGPDDQGSDDPAEFAVAIGDADEAVEAGESLTIEATVENVGDETATQTVTLAVGGETVDARNVTLDGNESTVVTFTQGTDDEGAGERTATVATEDDDASLSVVIESPENATEETETNETDDEDSDADEESEDAGGENETGDDDDEGPSDETGTNETTEDETADDETAAGDADESADEEQSESDQESDEGATESDQGSDDGNETADGAGTDDGGASGADSGDDETPGFGAVAALVALLAGAALRRR